MGNKLKSKYITVALVLMLVITAIISGWGKLPAFAESSYTGVLEDLQRDSTFNTGDYPDKANDYSIKVIQIAEGKDNELFIYTYQPCQKTTYLIATDINMSLSETAAGTKLYGLTLIDCTGVLAKYKVNNLTVSSDSTRFYNITSIYRLFNKEIDVPSDNGNTVNEVACPVGKVWKATTTSDGVKYEMKQVETVTITDKYVGTARYPNGVKWFTSDKCDSHFVAFATNRQIDTLLEADVTYVTQTYDKKLSSVTYGEKITNYKSLSCDQTATNTGLFGKKYAWNRILSVNEFSTTANLSQDQKNELNGKQWVLSFAETDYTQGTGGLTGLIGIGGVLLGKEFQSGTLVSEVSILRLKFITDGKTYNLGVVDNKQTGEGGTIPGLGNDDTDGKFNFWAFLGDCFKQSFTGKGAWWQITVVVIVIIVAITVFALVVSWLKWVKRCLFGKGGKQD